MNEVRDIVARMMEDPAPPARSAVEVLATARQVNRRRSWTAAASSGALALVMVVGAGVAVRSMLPVSPSSPPPLSSAANLALRVSPAHGAVMAQRIAAALPDGLSVGSVETFSDATEPVIAPDDGKVRILAAAVVRVVGEKEEGEIFAYLIDDGRAVTESPPSAAEVGAACGGVLANEGADSCIVVTVNDVAVQVVSATDVERGRRVEATRFLVGGRLVVGAWQGPLMVDLWHIDDGSVSWWLPPLTELPADDLLAALAADPAMLPA